MNATATTMLTIRGAKECTKGWSRKGASWQTAVFRRITVCNSKLMIEKSRKIGLPIVVYADIETAPRKRERESEWVSEWFMLVGVLDHPWYVPSQILRDAITGEARREEGRWQGQQHRFLRIFSHPIYQSIPDHPLKMTCQLGKLWNSARLMSRMSHQEARLIVKENLRSCCEGSRITSCEGEFWMLWMMHPILLGKTSHQYAVFRYCSNLSWTLIDFRPVHHQSPGNSRSRVRLVRHGKSWDS